MTQRQPWSQVPSQGTALGEAMRRILESLPKGIPFCATRGVVRHRNPHADPDKTKDGLYAYRSSDPSLRPFRTLLLEQAIPLPSGVLFQCLSRHLAPQTLFRPFEVPLGDGSASTSREDREILKALQTHVYGRERLLFSVERCIVSTSLATSAPSSVPIVLEAFDPLTGASVWRNPLISIEDAYAAYCVAPTAVHFDEQGGFLTQDEEHIVPEWFRALLSEAQDFGIPTERVHGFLVKGRIEQLEADGIPLSDAVPRAEQEVSQVENPNGLPLPAWYVQLRAQAKEYGVRHDKIRSFVIHKRVQQLRGTGLDKQEALTEAEHEVEALLIQEPRELLPQEDSPVPDRITLPFLLSRTHREEIQNRVLTFISKEPDGLASTRAIKSFLGIPEGSSGDPLRMSTALQRNIIGKLLLSGRLTAFGATKNRMYCIPKASTPRKGRNM